ncbi:hypothetical protein CASFOL_003964 [Castilleja foliolosa]|uniref:Uncharacterized protein n=1 Tax=Castilleja foliolosa TaxID=1961234 RepID=A0ABD3EIQ1_9LAMI
MVSPLLNASLINTLPSALISTNKFKTPCRHFQQKSHQIVSCSENLEYSTKNSQKLSYSQALVQIVFQNSAVIPLAASLAIVFWSNPALAAHAGFLSGSTGIESVPGPQLPQIDFLSRFNEENQKKYAENDARFRDTPILKKLLEQSKLNKEKNRQQTLDKYCIRGAEWGVGDCSAEGMSPEEKEKFIAMLKLRAGLE